MNIDCISDLHGFTPPLPGGDVLIVAGDCTARDQVTQWGKFFDWFKAQDYKKKILVAGNHDGFLAQCASGEDKKYLDNLLGEEEFFSLLTDCGCEYEGVKFYGSPWTPMFCNWYFMLPRGPAIKAKWDQIPLDTDILITHGPPFGLLDLSHNEDRCGCEELRYAIERIQPKVHIFGHIHEDGGKFVVLKHIGPSTLLVNAAYVDDYYKPQHRFMRIIMEEGRVAAQKEEIPRD